MTDLLIYFKIVGSKLSDRFEIWVFDYKIFDLGDYFLISGDSGWLTIFRSVLIPFILGRSAQTFNWLSNPYTSIFSRFIASCSSLNFSYGPYFWIKGLDWSTCSAFSKSTGLLWLWYCPIYSESLSWEGRWNLMTLISGEEWDMGFFFAGVKFSLFLIVLGVCLMCL